jgi:hypothetical protein
MSQRLTLLANGVYQFCHSWKTSAVDSVRYRVDLNYGCGQTRPTLTFGCLPLACLYRSCDQAQQRATLSDDVRQPFRLVHAEKFRGTRPRDR